MKKTILFSFALVLFATPIYAQQGIGLGWAVSMGGPYYDRGYSITTDAIGNVYTTGGFEGTADFDPGLDTLNLISAGNEDIFIQKLDPNGNLLWAVSMGGAYDDYGYSITTDAIGNVYTTGGFEGTADFDPGLDTLNLTSVGDEDIFIQKLDPNGNFLWARSMGGTSTDYGYSITTDAIGNVYTTGWFEGTADFDPGVDTLNLTSNGDENIFIQKLDPNGNLLWAISMGGPGNYNRGYSITTDAIGNVYTTGGFEGTADFDPGVDTLNLTSAGYDDIFIQKLDPNGNLLWARSMGGASSDWGTSITTDALGNVYTTGNFYSTADFDPGAGTLYLTSAGNIDIFVQKLDPNGNLLWAKSMGGSDYDFGYSNTIDASGNVYTTGWFDGTVDFDPGVGTYNLTSAGQDDIFIQKLDPNGNLLWVGSMGGISYDYLLSITTDTSGNVYTTGYFWGTSDFDPGAGIFNLTSAGNSDIFIHKLSPCFASYNTDSQTSCSSFTSPSGLYTWDSTGTYVDTIPNVAGCDSIITINLTINHSNTGTNTVSACDSFTSPSGLYTWNSTGTYVDTIPSSTGCDSVITLNLTINNSPFSENILTSPTLDGAYSVYAADVDGDGDMDVLSASSGIGQGLGWDDKIAWYENDGNQNLSAHTITTATDGATSVYATDVDGDGDMDVLSASRYDDKIAWYENDGNQNFTPHTITTSADFAHSVYATDVDGDGDMDVLSASTWDDKIAWYENDGNQNFTAHTITTAADGAFSVYAADVDGDGDMDVLSASAGDDKIAWYENDGNQNFTAHTITIAAVYANSVYATDVDGDGDMDVLSASNYDDKIAWYENDGNQNFTPHTITTAADRANSVYATDVDGDGDIDVLSASTDDDKIAWYENDGNQNFTAHTITTAADYARSVYAADLDGDGDMDVLSASYLDDKIAWYENDGNQSFTLHTITTTNYSPKSVYATDVDGDGDMDVLSASSLDDKIAWYENDGNQNFTPHTITTAADYAYSVYATDVDGDGDVDVLSASWMDNKIAWYENDGNQNFTPHTITTAANRAFSVYAADVDGDGDMDVLSADHYDDKIAWYENDGNQNFTPHTITTAAVYATSVYATDVDGDGDMDVLSASAGDDKIAWYENDGNQNFTPHTITTAADYANSVYATDVDGDGDIDVLSASTDDDKIAWYENDGNQNFTPHTITTAANRAFSVYATDVEGDGDMDVLSASYVDGKIVWYENNGNQNFTANTITSAANGATSVYGTDVDGDGDMDVLSASGLDGKIAWYENVLFTIDNILACNTYIWIDGNTYTTSNNSATDTLTDVFGCDSVIKLNLTINNNNTGTDTVSACDSYTWLDGNTYTSNNNSATHTLTNTAGCDSVVTLDLTMNSSNTGTDTQTACDSYTWINGNTYTSSNSTATHTLTNIAGCDSVVTLNLTINSSNTGTDTKTACDSYTWIDGNTYTSSNNTATHTLTNVAGCDSVVTLNLTINNNTGTDTQTACDSYTWIDGNTYTSSNSTATHTLTNAAGCDSVVTLNLTINNSNTGTDTQTACDGYTWIDGNTYTSSNNTATHTLTNTAGCDSVVTLNLTINNSSTGADTQTFCNSYTWIDGNTYTSSNNTAIHTLTNTAGCDSVVTLDLTINTVDNGVTNNFPTLTATATSATYQWLDCANNYSLIAGEINQSFTATANGSYAVEVTQNNCTDTSVCELVTVVGLLETKKSELLLYPNPTTGILTIEGAKGIVTIYDIYGRLVLSANTNTLDISNAAMGIYFVRVVDDQGKVYVGKVVKE